MNFANSNPISLISFFTILSFLPIIVILTTSFVKMSMVLLLARESLGTQQIPPNIVIYCISLILSFYVMAPVYQNSYDALTTDMSKPNISCQDLVNDFNVSSEPLKSFLQKHTPQEQNQFFFHALNKFWSPQMMTAVHPDSLLVLIPGFMISELTKAFKIGFLIYLPSVVIDILVSNILVAMGMMMMSPVTISLPIKILLFIALNGWDRLIHALLNSYL